MGKTAILQAKLALWQEQQAKENTIFEMEERGWLEQGLQNAFQVKGSRKAGED